MVRTLLINGMLVGILAGLLVFGFAKVFGEPQVEQAIAFEAAVDAAHMAADATHGTHDMGEPELVSRPMQASYGLLTGVMVYSIAFGGLFALAFSFVQGRLSVFGPRATSALLALAGLVSFYIVPSLKYPANPPSVGQAETIGLRTELYFIMMALSIAAMVGAVVLCRRLAPKYGAWSASLIAGAIYFVAVAVVATVLMPVNEVPNTFPAVVLWSFRVDSLAMQVIMWATLGLGFGMLAEGTYLGHGYRPRASMAANWR